jgi:hypothetical protein
LLRARRERPRSGSTAQKADEFAPPHVAFRKAYDRPTSLEIITLLMGAVGHFAVQS